MVGEPFAGETSAWPSASFTCISGTTCTMGGVLSTSSIFITLEMSLLAAWLALGVEHSMGATMGEAGLSVLSPDLLTMTCTGSE